MKKSVKETLQEYFSPVENKAPIQNAPRAEIPRSPVPVAVDERTATIEAIVASSKDHGGYQRVPLYLLSIPRYQRKEKGKVKKIASE